MTEYVEGDRIYELMTDCICPPSCPSYTVCAKIRSQRFYCMKGKSPTGCIHDELGCVCQDCDVGKELGKGAIYYCRYDRTD